MLVSSHTIVNLNRKSVVVIFIFVRTKNFQTMLPISSVKSSRIERCNERKFRWLYCHLQPERVRVWVFTYLSVSK